MVFWAFDVTLVSGTHPSDVIWASFFFFKIKYVSYSTQIPKPINENRFKCAIK